MLLDSIKSHPRFFLWNRDNLDDEGSLILYWMQRAQRTVDNPAFSYALEAGTQLQLPVCVCFVIDDDYPMAQIRHFRFMLQGLDEVAAALYEQSIPFLVRMGSVPSQVAAIAQDCRPALVVTDENPLRHGGRWRRQVAAQITAPLVSVDADVLVPSRLLPKEEYAARTVRPKIHRLWEEYAHPWKQSAACFQDRLPPARQPGRAPIPSQLESRLHCGVRAQPVSSFTGGTKQAFARLDRFLKHILPVYDQTRNRPEEDGTSRLSPYLHFGQIGPHSVVWAVERAHAPDSAKRAFLEELIVRRELAVNYVFHNPHYDSLQGCHSWAQKTLYEHWDDPREYRYSLEQLTSSDTHDPLWNAAQRQLLQEGWMHGYLRMYWAKKILEWTEDPEQALSFALQINDTFELDGRDPNGYTGVAWAIGGKHDRAWGPERSVFGKIRYMSYESTRRKFGARQYMERYS